MPHAQPAAHPLLEKDIRAAEAGVGDLLQRDYWAAIEDCRVPPAALMAALRQQFCEFPPAELVRFQRSGECGQPLALGDELDIEIRMAGPCRVRVTDCDEHSMTLGTLYGHPEAGRITFGCYRHETGDVIFHIRSRSRSGDLKSAAGFFAIGEAMQTNTWTDFVRTVAVTYGEGILGELHAKTSIVEATDADAHVCEPTFRAKCAD
ncbi:MAG: DUF1990 family protein [Polyangiaceae bacterium]